MTFDQLIHCTTKHAWKNIEKNGLSRMNRNCIYFTTRLPSAGECNVFIYINVDLALRDGFKFVMCGEDIVVCSSGIIPPKYIKQVVFTP